jgi:CHC2 zinc finger
MHIVSSRRNYYNTPPPWQDASFLQALEAAVMARSGKKRGREIKFRCPVHDDTHPSASYNVERAIWKCHACGAGGGATYLSECLGEAVKQPWLV